MAWWIHSTINQFNMKELVSVMRTVISPDCIHIGCLFKMVIIGRDFMYSVCYVLTDSNSLYYYNELLISLVKII